MKYIKVILVGLILTLGTISMSVYAGNGHGNGHGNQGDHGNHGGNGNGNGHGDDGDNDGGSGGDTVSNVDCEFNESNVLYDLEGTLIAFKGNPNKNKSGKSFVFETTGGEKYLVKTAPSWYLDLQEVVLEEGDELTITGFVCDEDDEGETSLIAMWIVKGEDTLELRNELGHPLWSAYGHFSGCSNNISKYPTFEYDIANEEVEPIVGTILSVDVDCLNNGDYPGYILNVKLQDETEIKVVLAPYWFLANQFFELEENIEISITGMFYVLDDDSIVLIARKLETENSVIFLRDEKGIPFWQSVRLK